MDDSLEYRAGFFEASLAFIYKHPDQMLAIMSKCIVLRAYQDEAKHLSPLVKYTAISEHFDLLNPGDLIPEYEVLIHTDGNGYNVVFKKKEQGNGAI